MMLVIKKPPVNAGDTRDNVYDPWAGKIPGEGNGNPLQYSCLENPMDRGAWQATVHRVTNSWMWLKQPSTQKAHVPSSGEWSYLPLLYLMLSVQFSSVQSFSHVQLFANPWTALCQASLSITNSQSLLKLMYIESVMPSTINHLIFCRPLLLPPSIFPNIKVFSNESVLRIRWQKYWSFSFSISPSREYSGLISFMMD